MADNIDITPGSGATARTVDRAGVETQVMLHDVAQTGESELLGLGDTRIITATSAGLTTASTAYTAGDQLGTELSFTSAVRAGKGGWVTAATLLDNADVVGAVDLFLFESSVTPAADNAANSWSDADIVKLLGVIHFADVISSASNRVVLAINLPVMLKPASGTTIYGSLVTRAAHTFFGSTTSLRVRLGISQD